MFDNSPNDRVVPFCSVLALTAGLALPAVVSAQNESDETMELDEVVVSTTRTETTASDLTRAVTVVTEEEIQEQAQLDRNVGTIIAKKVPGFSPSTKSISNHGQTLRGRGFLVLIDGVPQSTPLRDGGRDLNTIDPAAIERVEVVRGGTAIYGFGATGGLVNVNTKEPSEEAVAGYSQAGTQRSTTHWSDSGQYETTQRVSGTQGDWDYLASGTVVKRNGMFDSEGRRIPPSPLGAQGGFADSEQVNALGKLGREFDDGRQRLELTFNHFENEQDSEYTYGAEGATLDNDPTPDSRRTSAIRKSEANADTVQPRSPGTENSLAQVQYSHRDVLGGSLRLNTYYGEQSVVYPNFPHAAYDYPQSEITSDKVGSRLTFETPISAGDAGTRISWGGDYLHDETESNYFGGPNAREMAPAMEQDAFAAFAQLHVPIGDSGLVRAGVRHELISVDTSRVESNANEHTVQGGTLEYSETLPNLSGVLYLSDTSELFASYSQGFSIADLGRVITDAGPTPQDPNYSQRTFEAEEFESEAQKVDNYEIGVRGGKDLRYSVAAFYSESDNGTTFDDDLRIQKFSEEVYGMEASLDYDLTRAWMVGGTYSQIEGERESEDGVVDLDNTRIAPVKTTVYADFTPSERWGTRLQVMNIGDREPELEGASGYGSGDVEGYTLVDLTGRVELGPGTLNLSVANLLNEDYYPAINQAANVNYAFAKGPGRTVGAGYEVKW